MKKILIAVPTFESIYPDVFKAIYELHKPEDCELYFDFIRGYDCAAARNRIVKTAKERKADYILMIDNDVIVKPETLLWFMEDEADVCLGYYPHRDADNVYRGRMCVCKLENEKGERYFHYPAESEYTADDMKELRESGNYKIQIHGGGMGCAFINTKIFDLMNYPWYYWVNYDDGNVLSEDLYFCEQCKRLQIPIYTDSRIECGHFFRYIQNCR